MYILNINCRYVSATSLICHPFVQKTYATYMLTVILHVVRERSH